MVVTIDGMKNLISNNFNTNTSSCLQESTIEDISVDNGTFDCDVDDNNNMENKIAKILEEELK